MKVFIKFLIKEVKNLWFNNHFRTTKNTEAIVFENGGFVGNLGLSKKNYGKVY